MDAGRLLDKDGLPAAALRTIYRMDPLAISAVATDEVPCMDGRKFR